MHEEVAFWANRARGEIFFFFFCVRFGAKLLCRDNKFRVRNDVARSCLFLVRA